VALCRGGCRICQRAGPWRAPLKGAWERSPLKLKTFVHFHTKEGSKVKDLSDNPPLCPRQTDSRSHDQPWSMGEGGRHPVFPCLTPPLTWPSCCLKIVSYIIGLGSLHILKDRIWLLVFVLEPSVTFLCMHITSLSMSHVTLSVYFYIIVP